jgi:hypothetical protein
LRFNRHRQIADDLRELGAADIEFQTFDRLIDRIDDHITRHTNSLTTCTNHDAPAKSLPKRLQKDPAPRGAALFSAEDDQDIAAKTRHPPLKIATSFHSSSVSTIDVFFDGHAFDFYLLAYHFLTV